MRSKLLFFFMSAAFAVPALADGIGQLRTFLRAINSIDGQFVQSVARASGRKQDSSGTFSIQRPGKFRWNYLKPYEHLIVSDGEKLWSYDTDLKQASVRTAGKMLGDSPAALLAGKDIDRDFILQNAGSAEGLDIVDALPKAQESTFVRVRIGLSHNLPRLMEIRDNFGQTTTLLLQNLRSNPQLSSQHFRFTPPPGVDVAGE